MFLCFHHVNLSIEDVLKMWDMCYKFLDFKSNSNKDCYANCVKSLYVT